MGGHALHARNNHAILTIIVIAAQKKCSGEFRPRESQPMRLKLYCNRYAHFKDALVCAVNCAFRTRCREFALFYDEHRESVDAAVGAYFDARRGAKEIVAAASVAPAARELPVLHVPATVVDVSQLIRLEVKREMAEPAYIWIGSDDRAELLELTDVLRRAERGAKAKHIYKVAQEMELRFQLVPRKGIEKAKRIAAAAAAAESGRAAAKRSRSAPETPTTIAATTNSNGNVTRLPNPAALAHREPNDAATAPVPARRPRVRAAKAAGEK